MVRRIVQEHIFRHPWERVTAANWKKYADLEHRPLLSHVVDVSVVNKSVDQEGGQLLTTRAITVNIPAPWWLKRVVGTDVCQSLEESILDNERRSLEMVTRNVTLKDFVDVEEKCSYLPHPENPEWTLFRQQTSITCTSGSVPSVAEKIEQQCAEKFQQNSQRGREVVESVCRALERTESTAVATKTTATKKAEPLLVSSRVSSRVSSQLSSSTRRPSNFMQRIFDRALERAESTAVATQTTATKKAEPLLVSSLVSSRVSSQFSSSKRRPSNFIMRRIFERAELVGRSNFDTFFFSSLFCSL